jgi:hypothetical protein
MNYKCLKKRRNRFCQRDVQGFQLSDTAVADCQSAAQCRNHSPFQLSSGGLISNGIVEIQVLIDSKGSKNKTSGDKSLRRYGRMDGRALTSFAVPSLISGMFPLFFFEGVLSCRCWGNSRVVETETRIFISSGVHCIKSRTHHNLLSRHSTASTNHLPSPWCSS